MNPNRRNFFIRFICVIRGLQLTLFCQSQKLHLLYEFKCLCVSRNVARATFKTLQSDFTGKKAIGHPLKSHFTTPKKPLFDPRKPLFEAFFAPFFAAKKSGPSALTHVVAIAVKTEIFSSYLSVSSLQSFSSHRPHEPAQSSLVLERQLSEYGVVFRVMRAYFSCNKYCSDLSLSDCRLTQSFIFSQSQSCGFQPYHI